ncbi:MAG: CoA transferase [Mycobacterium sp.]
MASGSERQPGGVLAGIEVLDLTDGIAGAITTMLLADQGATVLKVEPRGGDPTRAMSGAMVWHRSKRSAVFDLEDSADRDAVRALAVGADVVVASSVPGEGERLGLDGEALCSINPRLVHCSITAYGRDNRHAGRPDDPALVAARTGLVWEERGWPGGGVARMSGGAINNPDLEVPDGCFDGARRAGPVFPYTQIPALGAAYLATTAISAALFARGATGRGQRVETSQLQGVLAATWGVWQRAEQPDAPGYDTWIFDSRGMRGMFECADGRWVSYWVPAPGFVLGASAGDTLAVSDETRPISEDPSRILPDPNELVVLHHYFPEMAKAFKRFRADEWVRVAAEVRVALQPVRSPEEALADPALLACGSVITVPIDSLGDVRQVGVGYRLANRPAPPPVAPPGLDRDGTDVRAEAARRASAHPPPPPPGEATGAPPLDGITVLDLGLAVAGPWGAQLLSDLGADVIKVNRLYDQFWHSTHLAMACNRGKRSLAVDLKHPDGLAAFHRLVAKADVVHHNMRPDAARRLGVDYDSLRQHNPRLIYCQTTGFDPSRSHLPGNDQTGSALAGPAYEDGGCAAGGRPIWSLTSLGDIGNGFLSAIAVVQALLDRQHTGTGQFVETSILDAQLLNASYACLMGDGTPVQRPRLDAEQFGTSAFRRIYETKQGWLCISAEAENSWCRCLSVLGCDALAADPALATVAGRREHESRLVTAISSALCTATAAEWSARLDVAGVPNEVCSDTFALDLFDDPDLRRSGFVAGYPQPVVGHLEQLGVLFDFSETPTRIAGAPPVVGDSTRQILEGVGYTNAELDELEHAQVILDTSA